MYLVKIGRTKESYAEIEVETASTVDKAIEIALANVKDSDWTEMPWEIELPINVECIMADRPKRTKGK